MNWLKQHKKWLAAGLVLVAALAIAYWYGGSATPAQPAVQSAAEPAAAATPDIVPEAQPEAEPETDAEPKPAAEAANGSMVIDPETGRDQYQTDPVPEGKPAPVEPENATADSGGGTCTISISCATILDNMDLCAAEKKELVPADGVILPATAVSFSAGESVFDLLLRVCQSNGIHMEYVNTPMYNSAYIEGVNNLYEFDVGELSGWMYKVNDWFPNYGCSRYQLADGDVIAWVYTCDLGFDVGGGYAVGE